MDNYSDVYNDGYADGIKRGSKNELERLRKEKYIYDGDLEHYIKCRLRELGLDE